LKQKMIDYLLNHAGPSIVLRVKKEILNDITEKEENRLQRRILEEKKHQDHNRKAARERLDWAWFSRGQ